MSFSQLKYGYPFPGAATKFFMPPGDNDWQPKSWGLEGYADHTNINLWDATAHFQDDGVAEGDVVYVVDAIPYLKVATTVAAVASQTLLLLDHMFILDHTRIKYKVGIKAPHDLQTLMNIIHQREVHDSVIHWSTLWTRSPLITFDHTELGDIYCCHNPSGNRLTELEAQWLNDNPDSKKPNPWRNLNPEPIP